MGPWLFADPSHSSAPPSSEAPRPSEPTDAPPAGARGPDAREQYDEHTVGGEINLTLTFILPWVTSLLFHLGIIILAVFLVWSLYEPDEREPIIPSARLSDNPGGALYQAENLQLENTQEQRKIKTEQVATEQTLENLNLTAETDLALVGLSAGGGGKEAPFGTAASASGDFSTGFFGAGGNARRIVYVVDASGSLIDSLPFVIVELKNSISMLSDEQQFTVVFFQGGAAIEVPPAGWKKATPQVKQSVAQWITLEEGNIIPRGSTNPVAALRLAMRYRPELVYILSDNITGRGKYEVDRDRLLGMLDAANPNRNTKINTIQFLYPDPLNTLRDIAEAHGGVYRFVSDDELGLR